MESQYESGNVTDYDVVRSTQFVDDFPRGGFRVQSSQPQRFGNPQMYGMPYQASYHQAQNMAPWQPAQPVFGQIGNPGQHMYSSFIGTPVATSNGYSNQLTYATQPREVPYDGPNSNHILAPAQNLSQGAILHSQPGQLAPGKFYASQPFRASGHENTHLRIRSNSGQLEQSEGQGMRFSGDPAGHGQGEHLRELPVARDRIGVRASPSGATEADIAATTTSALGRRNNNQPSTAYTPGGPGTMHDQHDSTMEQVPVAHIGSSPIMLSSNSSKSSPPYTLSQRKQLRVEEKSYLKEVKRSIAEGRVPQVRLQQNNSGDIVQYKAQFLNALKLAALAIVPNADINTKNPSTMQEIMKEVRRQFIIEKPLPEGMVEGYLQRLYKRNRAVYHRHWSLHGDDRKPDDCSLAAWSQLVDYWKSKEGNRECERNKSNASSKKKAHEKRPVVSQEKKTAGSSKDAHQLHTPEQDKPLNPKHQENGSNHRAQPRRAHATQSSKLASSDSPLERPPMRDISNKLHALVDEFVSNLSSECDSLANNISSQASKYVAHASGAEAVLAPRSSNRTAMEVLNGLRRPSDDSAVDKHRREGKSHVEHGNLKWTPGNSNSIEDKRFVRCMRETKHSSASLEGTDTPDDVKSLDISSEDTLSRDKTQRGRGNADMAAIGKHMQTIEILSSDQSSDDCLLTSMKQPKKKMVKQNSTSIRTSNSRGRTAGAEMQSPSVSRESSHVMNYSYEEDTNSLGGGSEATPSTFRKLSWPADERDDQGHGTGMNSLNNSAHTHNESQKKSGRKPGDEESSHHERDESNEEDLKGSPQGSETDGEDIPVLPRVPVKRKLMNEGKGSDRKTQRGQAKIASPQMKKQKTPQLDASVITQLEFGRRPQNCNPIRVRVKVWVLHPKYEGKVVAEAYTGINHKSRCINDEQDLCKKGEQMISVIRVFYKDTPVMLGKEGRFPKHIAFMDQVEGLPNNPILWGVPYIIQIPSMEEITRMMGNVTSSVCGKVPTAALEQGQKGRLATKSSSKKPEGSSHGKAGDSVKLKNKTDTRKVSGQKSS